MKGKLPNKKELNKLRAKWFPIIKVHRNFIAKPKTKKPFTHSWQMEKREEEKNQPKYDTHVGTTIFSYKLMVKLNVIYECE